MISKEHSKASQIWQLQKDTGIKRWPLLAIAANSKVPIAGSRGYRDATTYQTRTTDWPANANIAVAPGKQGFGVLDIDGGIGLRQFGILKAELGPLPRSVVVETPNGLHYYFRADGYRVDTRIRYDLGIDVLGEGRYALLPPSQTAKGQYEWVVGPDCPIAELPASWRDYLLNPPSTGRASPALYAEGTRAKAVSNTDEHPDWCRFGQVNADVFWARIFATLPSGPGQRNHSLTGLAQELARYCEPTTTSVDAVADVVRAWHAAARRRGSRTPVNTCLREFAAVWERTQWRPQRLLTAWSQTAGTRLVRTMQLCQIVGRDGGQFVLGERELARVAGCTQQNANKILSQLRSAGAIQLAGEYRFSSRRRLSAARCWTVATEYRHAPLITSDHRLARQRKTEVKTCVHCTGYFEPVRSTGKYCSDQCRHEYHNERR